MSPLKPPRLRRGDVVGLVAPASPLLDPGRLAPGIRYLEQLGYRVEIGPHLQARHGFFAGTDAQRAADFNAFARDPRVRAIFGLRGGYGSARLLPHLDYRALRRNPKIIVGFSDLTALQLALLRRTGLVTFSGPLVGVEFAAGISPFTEEHFWRLITSRRRIGRLPHPSDSPLSTLQPGRAAGPLIAGNLAILLSLANTPYLPTLKQAILVVEDVGEHLHRVDRMLTQLCLSGTLANLAGLVFGSFSHCRPSPPDAPHSPLASLLREASPHVPGPVASGLAYGHTPERVTLPIGLRARLDASRGTLSIPESAVL